MTMTHMASWNTFPYCFQILLRIIPLPLSSNFCSSRDSPKLLGPCNPQRGSKAEEMAPGSSCTMRKHFISVGPSFPKRKMGIMALVLPTWWEVDNDGPNCRVSWTTWATLHSSHLSSKWTRVGKHLYYTPTLLVAFLVAMTKYPTKAAERWKGLIGSRSKRNTSPVLGKALVWEWEAGDQTLSAVQEAEGNRFQ